MVKKDPSLGVRGKNHVHAGSLSPRLYGTGMERERNGRFNGTEVARQLNGN